MNKVIRNQREFILGGKAEFKICQKPYANDDRTIEYRYKVISAESHKGWYVYVYSNDIKKYVYAGFLTRRLVFTQGKKGNMSPTATEIRGLIWAITHSNDYPENVGVYHLGRCSVCGRKLTDIDSLSIGVGKVCLKKLKRYNL